MRHRRPKSEGRMNFYSVLGIPSDADDETIRHAYRTLARRYHPDRGAGSSAEKFREIAQAYETLSDRQRRRLHDIASQPYRPFAGAPVEPRGEPMTAAPESIYQ